MVIKSSSSNYYLYHEGKMMLIHPCLASIFKGTDISKASTYYKRKYNFLKKYNFFQSRYFESSSLPLNENIVIKQLQDLKAISIEITENCNMRCTYCGHSDLYEHYNYERSDNFINERNVYELINELNRYWESKQNKEIEISFYGGEPLLGIKQIRTIVSFLHKNYPHINFRYKITTNGLLLLKNISFLVENDFKIAVSLDGNERHNAYRILKNGQYTHRKVVAILDEIKKTYPFYYKNNMHISSVLHNLNDISEIQTYVKDRLQLGSYIGELNTNNIKNVYAFKKMYKSKDGTFEVKSKSGKTKKEHRPNEKKIYHFLHHILRNSYVTITNIIQKNSSYILSSCQKTCLPFNRELYLTVKGDIFPCETIPQTYPLGYIRNGNVYLSPTYITNLYNNKMKQQYQFCKGCHILPFCSICLFQVLSATEKENICPQYSDEKTFKEYIMTYVDYFELNTFDYINFCFNLN